LRYRFADFEADATTPELSRAGSALAIEPKPLRLLLDLLSHAPAIRSADDLLAALWPGETVTASSLTRAVHALRRVLGEPDASLLETVRGRGYRIVAPVERLATPADPAADWPAYFVGRDELLAVLEARVARAEAGEGSLVLVTGEPGIGKTRTAEILAERAQARGIAVHWGRCVEGGGGPPYLPWFEILRAQLEAETAGGPFLAQRRRIGRYLAILMPDLLDPLGDVGEPPRLAAEEARYGLFDAVVELIRHTARKRPLLLILDDLHQADAPSLRLLAFLARRVGELRLLVLGTLRSRGPAAGPALDETLAEISSLPHVEASLEVYGLARHEVASLLCAALAGDPLPSLVDSVYEATGGNPFFVREVTRDLVRSAAPPTRLPGAPASVQRAVAQRVAALPALERRVLETAAVVGREAPLGLVARAAGLSVLAVLDTLPPLVDGGFIELPPSAAAILRFHHALVREALYAALRPAERMALHAAVGDALEGMQGDAARAELAWHFAEAAPLVGLERALTHLLAAGRAALERLAGEEAERLFEQALALLALEPGDWRAAHCELLLGLGEAHDALGKRMEARQRFGEAAALARRLDDPRSFARAALGAFRHVPGHARLGEHEPDAIALLEEALAKLGNADERLRLELMSALVPKLCWAGASGVARAEELSAHALDEARSGAPPELRALVACRRHLVLWHAEGLEQRLALAQEAIPLVDPGRDPALALEARFLRVVDLLELGSFERAWEDVAWYHRLAQEIHHPHLVVQALAWEAARATAEGRLADAEGALAEARLVGAGRGAPAARPGLALQRILLDWAQGGTQPLDPRWDVLAEGEIPLPGIAAFVAWQALEREDEARARRLLERILAHRIEDLPRRFDSLFTGALLAQLANRLEDRSLAARLLPVLHGFAGRHAVGGLGVFVLGALSRSLGLLCATLERFDAAERHFEEARAANWRAGARLWKAETLCDHAELLRRRDASGDRAQARRLLAQAIEDAEEAGLGAVRRRTDRLGRELESVAPLRLPPRRRPHP
jgi:DNA-binding winged helix-turn-helix (wHTH) protein/tetratricopeptide (TPR) repeat protein